MTGKVLSGKLSCMLTDLVASLLHRSHLLIKKKEFVLLETKVFPLRVDPFGRVSLHSHKSCLPLRFYKNGGKKKKKEIIPIHLNIESILVHFHCILVLPVGEISENPD